MHTGTRRITPVYPTDDEALPHLLLEHPGDQCLKVLGIPYIGYIKEVLHRIVEPLIRLHVDSGAPESQIAGCKELLNSVMGGYVPDESNFARIKNTVCRTCWKRDRRCDQLMLLDEVGWGFIFRFS